MEGLRDVMNAAVTGEGGSSKRIAGEVGREYILQKDAPLPLEAEDKKDSGRFGRFGSAHSGGLGKPPLAPTLGERKVRCEYLLFCTAEPLVWCLARGFNTGCLQTLK
jgi:hypothetical protein